MARKRVIRVGARVNTESCKRIAKYQRELTAEQRRAKATACTDRTPDGLWEHFTKNYCRIEAQSPYQTQSA